MLEIKKLLVESAKVNASKMEFELKIMTAEEEIKRLQHNIEIQDNRILEISEQIKNLQGV